MTYDTAQESTWQWLTAQHISNFYAPAYTRDDPPSPCLTLREGHRPKMFLWMVEEFAFVLCHLHKDDYDAIIGLRSWAPASSMQPVLLEGGEPRGHAAQAQPPWIGCPVCTFKTLDACSASDRHDSTGAPGMGSVWQYYGAGWNTTTFRIRNVQPDHRTSSGQSIQGIAYVLPSVYICLFWCRSNNGKGWKAQTPKKRAKPQHYSMMRDVRGRVRGVVLCPKRKTRVLREETNHRHQCIQWIQTCPGNEMDEGKPTFLLWCAIRLLVAIETINGRRRRIYPSTGPQTFVRVALIFSCRPSHIPSHAYINEHRILAVRKWQGGRTTALDKGLHMCFAARMADASVGQRWIMEGGIRVPKITRVVEIFLNTTGMWVSPNTIQQCWPARRQNMLVQNLDGMRQSIVRKLDETATRCTSSIAWDQFAFPQMDQEYWREEALCYSPWEDARRRNTHAGLQTNAPRWQTAIPPLRPHPHFWRIYAGLWPSTGHCTMGAHMGNICHPDHVRTAVRSKRLE